MVEGWSRFSVAALFCVGLVVTALAGCETIELSGEMAESLMGMAEDEADDEGPSDSQQPSEDQAQPEEVAREATGSGDGEGADETPDSRDDEAITATMPALPADLPVAEWPIVADSDIGGAAVSVERYRDYAYFRTGRLTQILDVSNPRQPRPVGTTDVWGTIMGDHLYRQGSTELYSLDDPLDPTLVGEVDFVPVALGEDRMIVSQGFAMAVLDGTDPLADGPVTQLPLATFEAFGSDWGTPVDAELRGETAFVLYDYGLQIVDVSSVDNPREIGKTGAAIDIVGGRGPFLAQMELVDDLVYATGRNYNDRLRVFDVSDPANPEEIVYFDAGKGLSGAFDVFANYTDSNAHLELFGDTVVVVAAGGIGAGRFSDGELTGLELTGAPLESRIDVARAGDYLLVSEDANGLSVYDLSDPTAPRLVTNRPVSGSTVNAVEQDGILYVWRRKGLETIDVRSPGEPERLALLDLRTSTTRTISGMNVQGDWITLGGCVVDVSDPAAPRFAGSLPGVGTPVGVRDVQSGEEQWNPSVSVNGAGVLAASRFNREARAMEVHLFEAGDSRELARRAVVSFDVLGATAVGFLDDGRLLVNLDGRVLVELDVSGARRASSRGRRSR